MWNNGPQCACRSERHGYCPEPVAWAVSLNDNEIWLCERCYQNVKSGAYGDGLKMLAAVPLPCRNEVIREAYEPPPLKIAPKPKELTGPLAQAWDYLTNCGGVCKTSQFDDDFAPAGPAMRRNLAKFGVTESTSDEITIMMLPE